MELEEKVTFWKIKAKENYRLAQQHYKLKNYAWCLFLCHLALEKMLKARVLESTKREAPYTHDLVLLAKLTHIKFGDQTLEYLDTINKFNIEARYEDYKDKLKRRADATYTKKILDITKDLFTWFSKQK